MIIFRDSSALPSAYKQSVLALGNFDGLHLGHRAILKEAKLIAQLTGKKTGVMTFEPHPRRVFKPELPPLKIFPFHEKVRMLAGLGIDFIRVVRFTRAFSENTAEYFVNHILHDEMDVSHIVTGEDFIFGHKRTGNAAYLRKEGARLGFDTTACKPVLLDGERCSSTRLRALLAEGDMPGAARLLSKPYSISGHVREGDKRGRTIGFPTANIIPAGIFLPATGVYAIQVSLCHSREGGNFKAKTTAFAGVTRKELGIGVANFGSRPTFNGKEMRLEVHLFDFNADLYSQKLEVKFVKRIRDERKFDGIEALKTQIAEDCEKAKQILV